MANPVVKYVLEMDDKASGPLKDTGKAAKDAAKDTDSASVSMAGLATAAVATAAAIAAVGFAWVKMMQSTADARNDLNDMSVRTGVAAETLKGLKLAAEGSGLQLSVFESGLSKLPKRMHDAQGGMKEVLDAFNELGVAFEDEQGTLRDTDTVFREITEALSGIENPAQRSALATDLLGRSGKNLMQALGTSELDDFIEAAERFGTDVGPAASKAADDWQRQMALLGAVTDNTADSLANAFGMEGAAGALETFNFALTYMSEFAGRILSVLTGNAGAMATAFSELMSGNIKGFREATAEIKRFTGAGLISDAHDRAVEASAEFQRLSDLVGGVSDKPRQAVEVLTASVEDLEEGAEGAADAFGQLTSAAEGISAIQAELNALIDKREKGIESITFAPYAEALAASEQARQEEMQSLLDEWVGIQDNIAAADERRREHAAELWRLEADAIRERNEAFAGGITAGAGAVSTLAGGDLIGAAGGLTADPYSAAIFASLQALITIGEIGNEAIVESVEAQLDALARGIANLPVLIPLITDAIIDAIPEIMDALIEAAPAIMFEVIPLILSLPYLFAIAVGEAIMDAWRENAPKWMGGGGEAPAEENKGLWLLDTFQSGGFVPKTQLAMLHQGEYVVPAEGMLVGGSSGPSISISTAALDRDAIPALVRQIERVYGSFGRASSPLFAGG